MGCPRSCVSGAPYSLALLHPGILPSLIRIHAGWAFQVIQNDFKLCNLRFALYTCVDSVFIHLATMESLQRICLLTILRLLSYVRSPFPAFRRIVRLFSWLLSHFICVRKGRMLMNVTRKTFLSLLVSGTFACVKPSRALAGIASDIDDVEGMIRFSPDVARSVAQGFADSSTDGKGLSAGEPIPIYSTEGRLVGYLVCYSSFGSPSGYVILNAEVDGLILEFSFTSGARGVYEHLKDEMKKERASTFDFSNPALVMRNPFEYGIVDADSLVLFPDEGEPAPFSHRNVGNDAWWDVWISFTTASSQYVVSSMQAIGDYVPITESAAKKAVGSYACGVHALYVIGSSMTNDAMTNTIIPYNDWNAYKLLWAYTLTTTTGHDNQGHALGSTSSSALGPGFVRLCKERGTAMNSKYVESPSYLTFVEQINRGSASIIGGEINTEKGASGHFMPVNGYCSLMRKSDKKILQCLMVFNGWEDNVYFNFDFPRFNWTTATFLYR